MGYRLIAADLDWTLLQSDGTLSPFTQDIIRQCMKAGVGFTFATGRMYCSALPFARQLQLQLPADHLSGCVVKRCVGQCDACAAFVPGDCPICGRNFA